VSARAAAKENESTADSKPDVKEQRSDDSKEKPETLEEPAEPDAISILEWETILERFDLLHCFDCSKTFSEEWPTKAAVDRSFECVRDLLENYLLPVHLKFRERRAEKIQFHDLWHLFQIDDLVVTKTNKSQEEKISSSVRGMRVLLTRGGRRVIHPVFPPPLVSSTRSASLVGREDALSPVNGINVFSIYAFYLDFDGFDWIPVRERFIIAPYSGERKITELEVYPIKYASNMEERLQKSGKKFYELVTAKIAPYVDCTGHDLNTREELNDKVIVDMKSYFNTHTGDMPDFFAPGPPDMSETSDCFMGLKCSELGGISGARCYHRSTKIIVDQASELNTYRDYIDGRAEFNILPCDVDTWEPDFTICHHRVFAYKLRSREWGE
jgi:hypothetical protein